MWRTLSPRQILWPTTNGNGTTRETFTWSAEGAAVSRWRLEVGTSVDGTDLFVQGMDAATTSVVVSGLPTDGSTIFWKSY